MSTEADLIRCLGPQLSRCCVGQAVAFLAAWWLSSAGAVLSPCHAAACRLHDRTRIGLVTCLANSAETLAGAPMNDGDLAANISLLFAAGGQSRL